MNLLLQKDKDSKILPTSFFCSRKGSSNAKDFLGKFKSRAENKEGVTDSPRREALQAVREKGFKPPLHSVPSLTHMKGRKEGVSRETWKCRECGKNRRRNYNGSH